jgi:glyoxylase-like metal-dependent hydrolase (beta-lactamase superfamily II)
VTVEQIAPGLWRWTARHPGWTPGEEAEDAGGEAGWEPDVGCVYCEAQDGIVLVDPLVPAEPAEADRFWGALDRDVERLGPPSVLLTVPWHRRSSGDVRRRYAGARVWASAAARDALPGDAADVWFAPGDRLPGGVEAHPTPYHHEVVYWLPSHRTLVPGDTLLGDGGGGLRLVPASWLEDGTAVEAVRATLEPLLGLSVERVLVSHGRPVLAGAREALARALAAER